MDYVVYVLNKDDKPLMPTKRFGKVRRMLKNKKAKVVCTKPFTIKLLFDTTNYTQDLTLGCDTGRTDIGITVSNEETGKVAFTSTLETRNKEIPKLMSERKAFRGQRRRNRRLVKVKLAKKNGTIYKNAKNVIHIGAKTSIPVKYIKNKPAKFNYRKRPDGWLTPTANQLLQTHLNYIKLVSSILPIKKYVIEYGTFDIQKLENAIISGKEYQKGTLSGFDSLEDFISFTQGNKCLICGGKIEHYHHIIPKHKGGADTHHDLAGLCKKCHNNVHKDDKAEEKLLKLKKGTKKRYDSTSILNTIMPFLFKELQNRYGEENVLKVYGFETKKIRDKLKLPKTHYYDSYTISLYYANLSNISIRNNLKPYQIKQFRQHNRQKLYATRERTYKLNGKIVAKNRNKRTEQKDKSLKEFREDLAKTYSKKEVRQIISSLKVTPSKRYYKSEHKFEQGNAVKYKGKRYIVKANVNNGNYLYLYNYPLKNGKQQNIPARDVVLISNKKGLVFL